MSAVHIKGELNGLGEILLPIMEQNLRDPQKLEKLKKIKGSLVATEKDTNISITILFDKGNIQLQSDIINNPSASVKTDFDTFAAFSSGEMNPIMGVLMRKISVRGNIFKLLKMVKILSST